MLSSHYSRRYAISITDTSCIFISGTGLKTSASRWAFLSFLVYASIPNQYSVPPSHSCWEAGVSLPRLIKLQSAWPRDYFALFNVNTSEIYLVCVLSCSSYIPLFVTLWTVAAMLLCKWDSPGRNTGLGSHAFRQGIFPTQGWNPCLLHRHLDSLPLSHQESPNP